MGEGHAPALAAHGSCGQAEDVGLVLGCGFGEGNHLAEGLHALHVVAHVDEEGAHLLGIAVVGDAELGEHLGHLHFAPGHDPGGKVIAGGVVDQGFHGHVAQLLPQVLHVRGPGDLGALAVPEDEVAEAQALVEETGELGAQGVRVLVQEAAVQGRGPGFLEGIRGLEQGGQIGDAFLQGADQLDAGLPVQHAILGELAVRDHAEQAVLELVAEGHGLFVRGGEDDLGPHPHGQRAGHPVHALVLGQPRGLLENFAVEDGQVPRVVADAVLHQEDHPGEAHLGVVEDIGAVLHELHHGHEDFGIPVPHEDLVVLAQQFLAPPVHDAHFHIVVQQQVDGDLRVGVPQGPG